MVISMKIFLSAETESPAANLWFNLHKEINRRLDSLTTEYYGDELISIGIISIILSEKYFVDGGYPERRIFSKKNKEADIRLRINFNEFVKATPNRRREIYVNHIIDAIDCLRFKVSKDFSFDKLMNDVIHVLKQNY